MKSQQKGLLSESEGSALVLVIIFVLIVIVGIGGYFFLTKQINTTQSMPQITTSPYPPGDINKDEKVDSLDAQLFKNAMNCKQSDPCWGAIIGHTRDGDNPIYASELDFNKDGVITETDQDASKQR